MLLEVFPHPTVEECRDWAIDQIDSAAGQARARYLTVAPGQEATYTAKYADAKAYLLAADTSDMTLFPWIKQEAERTGMTPQAAAQRIKDLGDYWHFDIGPKIEGLRMAGKDGLAALTTRSQVMAHTKSYRSQLALV